MAGQPHPGADVAEPGLGTGRGHAERDEVSLDRHRRRGPHGPHEAGRVADGVVGGQHQHHGVRVVGGDQPGGRGDRGSGAPADGFEDDRPRLDAEVPHLLGDREAVLLPAHQQRRGELVPLDPPRGLLQQADLGEQREQLLGEQLPGHRPQPGARPPGQDDGHDADVGVHGSP